MQYGLPLAEAVPLFAALLSLPLSADYAPLTIAPKQQKQQTLHALLTVLLRRAAQQPLLFLSWKTCTGSIPPRWNCSASWWIKAPLPVSWRWLFTLSARLQPALDWAGPPHPGHGAHRLPRRQAVEVIRQVAHGKTLPPRWSSRSWLGPMGYPVC